MAKRNKKYNLIYGVITIITIIALSFIGEKVSSDNIGNLANEVNAGANEIANVENNVADNTENKESENGEVVVKFLDVGQADSILVQSNGVNMLIDAGTNKAGATVVKDLQDLGVKKIDYLIGTHPHEDHIGGMDDVIKNFDIGTIFMPKIQTNTKTFEDVLDAIASKNLKVTSPEVGYTYNVGDAKCEIMSIGSGKNEEKSNLNLSSIVIRMTYGTQSFLFMGDAETENESSRTWPQTTVLKVGHHGSNTSSSQKFLNEVKPEIAVISVGTGNMYGHPKQTTLNKLTKIGAKIYRTDENGTVTITTDGKTCTVTTEK